MRPRLHVGRFAARRAAAAWSCAIAALGLGSCVTIDAGPESAVSLVGARSVIVPFAIDGDGARSPLAEYYQSVLLLLQDAVLERNPERLRQLCAQHDRKVAPAWARDQIANFREIARVLDAEVWLESESRIELRDTTRRFAIGEAIPLALRVPAGHASGVYLEGSRHPHAARFDVAIEITDRDCLGGEVVRRFSRMLELPGRAVEVGAEAIDLPFDLDALPPEGVLRSVRCRVEWLPGNVLVDSRALPNRRVPCADRTLTLYPRGIEPIEQAPLLTLQNALRSGETRHLDHAYLAAVLMPAADRRAATELLIDRVRLGPRVQARAAMAALAELTDEPISVDDREGWLGWWNHHGHVERNR